MSFVFNLEATPFAIDRTVPKGNRNRPTRNVHTHPKKYTIIRSNSNNNNRFGCEFHVTGCVHVASISFDGGAPTTRTLRVHTVSPHQSHQVHGNLNKKNGACVRVFMNGMEPETWFFNSSHPSDEMDNVCMLCAYHYRLWMTELCKFSRSVLE